MAHPSGSQKDRTILEGMRRRATLALLLLAAPAAFAQSVGQALDRYEMQYGEPVDVSISDLVQNPDSYEGKAVRTRGRLNMDAQGRQRFYALKNNFGESVLVSPVNEIAIEFDAEVLKMLGGEADVTGVFLRTSALGTGTTFSQATGVIQFWKFLGPEPETKGKLEAPTLSLEDLVTRPGRYDGKLVRAVGQFRGENLFHDLPVRSQKSGSDWVIKDDLFAVWVTGKKPKGAGFELDASLKRDTGKWIEVVGRAETRNGVMYLTAQRVALATAPTATSQAQPAPPPPERPKLPPTVVFALPLDGETVPADARFAVQFSKDMNEDSFRGNVLLRYAGRKLAGDRDFDGVKMRYDGGRRTLTVDPGDRLRPGRQVELVLLPGIADIDGLALVPRSGRVAEGPVVDVLRYAVGYF
jgi:hypothetical protein